MSEERKPLAGQIIDRIYTKGIDWIVIVVIGGGLMLVFEPLRIKAQSIWNGPDAIQALREDLAQGREKTNAILEEIKEGQLENQRRISVLTGDDKIIRIMTALSYVEEPVGKGQRLFLRLFISRTDLGDACTFLGGRSIFTDERGVPLPGSAVAVIMQANTSPRPLRIPLTPPDDLRVGKAFLRLELDYRCDGKSFTEVTPEFPFILNP